MLAHVSLLQILLACLAMAIRDCLGTLLTVAQARGRALLAGGLDASLDLAGVVVNYAGIGFALKYGLLDARTDVILGTMMVTSFFGTIGWTRLSRRIK